jgi:hypothetical protein
LSGIGLAMIEATGYPDDEIRNNNGYLDDNEIRNINQSQIASDSLSEICYSLISLWNNIGGILYITFLIMWCTFCILALSNHIDEIPSLSHSMQIFEMFFRLFNSQYDKISQSNDKY